MIRVYRTLEQPIDNSALCIPVYIHTHKDMTTVSSWLALCSLVYSVITANITMKMILLNQCSLHTHTEAFCHYLVVHVCSPGFVVVESVVVYSDFSETH